MTKKLFGWSDKQYDEEYWERLERNWKQWKEKRVKGQKTMEMIKEKEEEIEQENSRLREWTKKDDNEMENICNLYYEL